MKFKLDNRTGRMVPKKDDEIYFSRSMSGGLRVDDHLNDIKYVVERNENIKFIVGEDVNIYDSRNAHIISERVKRMFGSKHKYSNYKEFLKGNHMVKSFDDYVDESLWKGVIDRSKSGDIRKEQGLKVNLPNGGYVIMDDKGCGLPKQIGNDYFTTIELEGDDRFVFCYEDSGDLTYFIYDLITDEEDEQPCNIIEGERWGLVQLATSDYDLSKDDFVVLRGLVNSFSNIKLDDHPEIIIRDAYRGMQQCEVDNESYYVFDDEDNKDKYVEDYTLGLLDDIDKDSFDRYVKYFGYDFIDSDGIAEMQRESNENYVNDIENEGGSLGGSRLYDELEERELIEDSDEYFDTDEDGDLDYESPKFDVEDMKSQYVDMMCDDEEPVDWYVNNFGTDGLDGYIDKDKLAELIIQSDGAESVIGAQDYEEYNDGEYTLFMFWIG